MTAFDPIVRGGRVATDADVVIRDDESEVTITNGMPHRNVDDTPYEGIRLGGWPETVLRRGEVVVEDGEIKVQPGHGEFLPCAQPDKAAPAGRPVTDFQPA